MKILTFSHSGDAIETITNGRNNALKNLGHEVLCIDIENTPLQNIQDYQLLIKQIKEFGPDFACFYGFLGLFTIVDETNRSVPLLEKLDIPYAVLISNLGSLQTKGMKTLLSLKDMKHMHLFVWDMFYVETLALMGFSSVRYLPLASAPEKFFPISNPDEQTRAALEKYDCDVSFCGNSGNANFVAERCKTLPPDEDIDFLVGESFNFFQRRKILSSIKHTPVSYYGRIANGQEYSSNFKLCGWLHPSELNTLYNASRIVLNVFHPLVRAAIPMRIFDAMAAGRLVVSDRRCLTEQVFEDKKDIVFFNHPRELDELFNYYLTHEDERKQIARSGHEKVMAEHTWQSRMQTLIKLMADACGNFVV